jgi:quinol monooxygenase YgiN
MSIIVATRADARASKFDTFFSISVDIVNAMSDTPGNLGVRINNQGLVWFTLTAWASSAALDAFVFGDRHREAMEAVDELTHSTAFARVHTDLSFDQIPWAEVTELLSTR